MLSDKKLSSDSFSNKNVKSLPDNPSKSGYTAAQLKAAFDKSGEEVIASAVNGIIDELVSTSGAGNVGTSDGTTVQSHIDDKQNPHDVTASQVGAYTKAETDQKINQKVVDIGAADMKKSVYDKNNVQKDIFDEIKTKSTATLTHTISGGSSGGGSGGASGKKHILTGDIPSSGLATIRFKATAPYAEGGTFSINGVTYTAKPNGEETALPDKAFVTGDVVSAEIDISGHTINFKLGGGGFIDGFNEALTAEAFENIQKGDPITVQRYGSYDEGISLEPAPALTETAAAGTVKYHPSGNLVGLMLDTTVLCFKRQNDNFVYAFSCTDTSTSSSNFARSISFSPDGKYLMFARFRNIKLYTLSSDFTVTAEKELSPPPKMTTYTYTDSGGFFISPNTYLIARRIGSSSTPTLCIGTIDSDGNNTEVSTEIEDVKPLSYAAGYFTASLPNSEIGLYKLVGNTVTQLAVLSKGGSFFDYRNKAVISPNAYYVLSDNQVYKLNNDTLTALTTLSHGIGTLKSCNWSADSNYVVMTGDSAPYIKIFKRTNDSFSSVTNPTVLPNAAVQSAAFSPEGSLLTYSQTSPATEALRTYRTQAKNIVSKVKKYKPSDVTWLPDGKIGVALETKAKGNQIKVNLFPAINNLS